MQIHRFNNWAKSPSIVVITRSWKCIDPVANLIEDFCLAIFAYPTILSLVLSTEMVLQLLCSSTRAVVSVASLTIPTYPIIAR